LIPQPHQAMLEASRPAARFAGASEYDRSYKWNESNKSASFFPSGEQLRPTAGIESLRRYNVMEPPLQRRKRVEHVQDSVKLGVPETPTEDSFLLAGQKSDKFAPSQAHPNYAKEAHKKRSLSLAAQREQERLEQEQRQRDRKLRLQQKGGTEAAQKPAVNGGGGGGGDFFTDDDEPPVATPETPREVKRQLTMPDRQRKQREKQRQQQQPPKRHHRRRRHRSQEAAAPAEASVSTKELEAQLAKARRESRRLEAEALMRRGEGGGGAAEPPAAVEPPYQRPKTPPFYRDLQADPYAVRDPDYAKKRQLGLADAKRPQGNKPTKASEYQLSYAAAAAAAAEASEHQRRRERQRAALAENREAAHRSHLDVVNSAAAAGAKKAAAAVSTQTGGPGSKPVAVPVTTEYRRQFRYKQPDVRSPAVGLVPSRKSMTTQQQQTVAGPQPPKVKVAGREFKPAETLNPQRMSFPLGSYGPLESEYHRAFGEAAANGGETDWQRRLREARELRQRAAQYRLRAYGTHFSRQHLAQVYAPNLDAWQPLDSARSADDNNERPRTAPAQHPQAAWASDPEDLAAASPDDGDDVELDADGNGDDYGENYQRRRDQRQKPRRRRRARSTTGAGAAADAVVRRRLPESETVGRYGTPRVRDRARQGFVRHHYDRTTPNFGGVLVGRPDAEVGNDGQPEIDDDEAAVQVAAADSDGEQMLDDAEDLGRPLGGRKPVGRMIRESRQLLRAAGRRQPGRQRSPAELPPAGLPTRDVAPLVDETASHDTQLTLSPRAPQQQKAVIQRRRDEPRVNGSELSAATPPPPQQQPAPLDDTQFSDGFFSDTASLVSSSTISLGSQTLERARQRQESFWGRK
uniref:Nuclear protein MDM1 n=2 Tax=Macrostomum lignano TaxID=282301 RepID=A0A1I8FXE8_9PLAT